VPNPTRKRLEAAVKQAAATEGIAERRMRRWIAVIALIEIFSIARDAQRLPAFLIKGGLALEFRFRARARSSRDVDFVFPMPKDALMDALIEALRIEWSGFRFSLKGVPEDRGHSLRLVVNASYQGCEWSTFEVDLAQGSVDDSEFVTPYDLGAFGLMRPSTIPCLGVVEQIAQKLHAVTSPREDRARDLLDVFLLDTCFAKNDQDLLAAIIRVFAERKTHPWPARIELRETWRATLQQILARSGLEVGVDEIVDGVRAMIGRLEDTLHQDHRLDNGSAWMFSPAGITEDPV
jgi:predicted nucleotidyltransferase component of viral defense system